MNDILKLSGNKVSVTFYDLIGYIVPGYLLNLIIVMYSEFFFNSDILLQKLFSLNLIWSLIFAYVSGHLIQGISSLVFKFNYQSWWELCKWDDNFKKSIETLLEKRIGNLFSRKPPIDAITVNIVEALLASKEQDTNAEIYRALQSFYRALTSIFVLAAICFLSYTIIGRQLTVATDAIKISLSPKYGLVFSFLMFLSAILSYSRYKSFFGYRIRAILIGFMACEDDFNSINNNLL